MDLHVILIASWSSSELYERSTNDGKSQLLSLSDSNGSVLSHSMYDSVLKYYNYHLIYSYYLRNMLIINEYKIM